MVLSTAFLFNAQSYGFRCILGYSSESNHRLKGRKGCTRNQSPRVFLLATSITHCLDAVRAFSCSVYVFKCIVLSCAYGIRVAQLDRLIKKPTYFRLHAQATDFLNKSFVDDAPIGPIGDRPIIDELW